MANQQGAKITVYWYVLHVKTFTTTHNNISPQSPSDRQKKTLARKRKRIR